MALRQNFIAVLVDLILLGAGIFFATKVSSAENEEIAASLARKRNIFLGLFVVFSIILMVVLFMPVTFTEADTISKIAN